MPDSGRWTREFLEPFRSIGDPLADAVVQGIYGDQGAPQAGLLLQYLIDHDLVDAPALPEPARSHPLITDYLRATAVLPADADPEQFQIAADFFAANGPSFLLGFGFGTLPASYCSANGASILYVGSMLKSDTRRRLFETLQIVVDVLTPDALAAGGRAVHVLQKVRLMHAVMRYLTLRSPNYQTGWGLPINQEDMAGTLDAIVAVPLKFLSGVGRPPSARAEQAIVHTWSVAGRMLGLRDELAPTDLHDAWGLIDALERQQFARCVAGVSLARDLVAAYGTILGPEWLGRRLAPMLIRECIGDDFADLLEVAPTNWTRWLYRLGTTFSRFVTMIRIIPGAWRLEVWLGRRFVNGFLAHERGGERSSFYISDPLIGRWRVQRGRASAPTGN